jgi:hypothetical protein
MSGAPPDSNPGSPRFKVPDWRFRSKLLSIALATEPRLQSGYGPAEIANKGVFVSQLYGLHFPNLSMLKAVFCPLLI